MQRKNNILTSKNRTGFAMIMAIIVMIVIATLMSLSLFLTSETGKRTTDLYLYEQSVLYSKSAAELALLDIAQANPCTVSSPNYSFPSGCTGAGCLYDANVTISYVYTSPSPCASTASEFIHTPNIITPEQNGSVLMDITVTTNEGSEPIRYFRRTIQKL